MTGIVAARLRAEMSNSITGALARHLAGAGAEIFQFMMPFSHYLNSVQSESHSAVADLESKLLQKTQNRFASTHPAEPAPKIIKSYFSI